MTIVFFIFINLVSTMINKIFSHPFFFSSSVTPIIGMLEGLIVSEVFVTILNCFHSLNIYILMPER